MGRMRGECHGAKPGQQMDVEIVIETQSTEGGAGLGEEEGDGCSQSEAPLGHPAGDVCLCDYGWNSAERSRLGREIEELVA